MLLERLFRDLEEQSFIKGFEVTFFVELDEENHLLIDASAVQIGEETLYYLMIHNVTIEYKQRKIKDFLAYHDFLTGIYNRAYFEKFVVEQLKEIERNQGEAAILLCDLNFFKQINDTYGHQVGDQVLVYATELFKKFLPQPNVLARLGGDEFIILFENISSKELFLNEIEGVRTKFVENPYVKGDLSIEVVPSFGIVFTQEDGYEFHTLYLLADVRMYENKKLLKNIETF